MSEQGGEQQQQQHQRPPPPPRKYFQLSFHRFLKRGSEDPKSSRGMRTGGWECEEEEQGGERRKGMPALMRTAVRVRRGVAALRVEGSKRTWSTILG
eukprot:910252-Pelagomonas_calceolata.AAC.3